MNGACVPNCGEGTVLQGDECVLENAPIVCAEGTTEVDGECVADEVEPPCGEGTIYDETAETCVPVNPLDAADLVEADFAAEPRGKALSSCSPASHDPCHVIAVVAQKKRPEVSPVAFLMTYSLRDD